MKQNHSQEQARPHCPEPSGPSILAVGLNPAWQRILEFEHVEAGEVNRARKRTECIGGKAANVLRALACGNRKDTVLAQLAGGRTGQCCVDALDTEGIAHRTVRTQAETRTCTTVIEHAVNHRTTELIDPSSPVQPRELHDLCRLLETDSELQCRGTALCGTWPPGADASAYIAAAAAARKRGFVILDAWRDVEPVLRQGVDILKINDRELRNLTGCDNLRDAARACLDQYAPTCIAVTAGASTAYLFSPDSTYTYDIPPLDNLVNPIGAGDCVTAGMLAALVPAKPAAEGTPSAVNTTPLRPTLPDIAQAFRQGLAWGRASCTELIPARFNHAAADPNTIPMHPETPRQRTS